MHARKHTHVHAHRHTDNAGRHVSRLSPPISKHIKSVALWCHFALCRASSGSVRPSAAPMTLRDVAAPGEKTVSSPPQKPRRARESRSLRPSTPQTEHTLNTFFRFVFVAETEEKNQYDHVVLNGAKYASLCSVKSEWTRIDWDGQEWTQG